MILIQMEDQTDQSTWIQRIIAHEPCNQLGNEFRH